MSRLVFIVQNRIQRISIRSLRVCSHLAGCVGIFKPTDFVQRNHELRKLIKTKWTDLYIVKSNISFHFWRLISFLAISSRLWFNFGIFKYIYMKMFGIFMMIKWKKNGRLIIFSLMAHLTIIEILICSLDNFIMKNDGKNRIFIVK